MKPEKRALQRAIEEKRLCQNCGWMVTIKNWKKGYRLCAGCYDARKGVNVSKGHYRYSDEPKDITGDA